MMLRAATSNDAGAIAAIYNHYVATSSITFEESPVPVDDMARRIEEVGASLPWYVAEENGALLGYAYATPWRARSAYRYSVESTVYVSPAHARRGVGTQLYGALLAELRARGLRVVLGGIAQPNVASVTLHERLGFEKVAHFKQVGQKFGQWIDVGYWELLLEQ